MRVRMHVSNVWFYQGHADTLHVQHNGQGAWMDGCGKQAKNFQQKVIACDEQCHVI